MAARKPTAQDYVKATDAKHLLDMIGETIQQQAHDAALDRSQSALQGRLKDATFREGYNIVHVNTNVCQLIHTHDTNVTKGHGKDNPCAKRSDVRFSDTEGAQCDKSKIKDGNDEGGACAPYRRLHLCDQHLSHMQENNINDTHNLLLEVLLAAQYEGDSLRKHHDQYKQSNSSSQLCTVLARSFADIGDIVRGKDLYIRNKQEKENLEKNLRKIFKKIYEKLDEKIKSNYNDSEGNYYLLREDWWELNRLEVWKAITCNAQGNTYFRGTCSNDTTSAKGHCQCIDGTVPTNFDYVPQYLRWFEEWAEDFCRKKKKYVNIVKKFCREGDDGNKRYCSRNGYDCEKTKRAIGKLRYGKQCISCLYACNPYVDWINNQKEQFDKQKKKYDEEMQKYTNGGGGGGRRQKRDATTTKYEGYEKKFYDIDI